MPETAVFDHYEVLRRDDGSLFELGRGAMGITYKAFDTNLRCHVALKVINAASIDSDVARQRFVREARAAAQLRHRHVASVFHLGVEGDTYFYAMEFIDGETVESLIRRGGPLDPVLALRIAVQVTRALNAATKHELVHRDIKPSNLMLVREDEELVMKVIDFGLAKSSKKEDEETTAMLSMGGFVGTPHFASPEQLEEREIDVRSDIYSLGVTLWYMLAGGAPFVGSLAQVMSDHLHKSPPFERIKHVPEPVHDVLRHMLEKDPAKRPQTPAELRKELEDCISILAGGNALRPSVIAPDVELIPDAGEPGERDIVRRTFYTGAIIAGRYAVLEDLGEGNAGWSFRAKDQQEQRDVRLMVLHSQWAETPDALTQIEREVERLRAVQHPNLMRVFGIERAEDSSFVVLECMRGFSLLEVLRARQELTVEEALPLLQQAATGVDFAINRGLKRLDIALHQITIDFPNAPAPVEPLLEQRVTQWPNWTLKLNALGITRELALSDTWAGGQTIVGGIEPVGRELSGANPAGRYVQALAALGYELLGGTLSPVVLSAVGLGGAQPAPRYVPLATLSEYGNEVLKQALDPSRSFGSALEFCRALKNAAAEEIIRHDTTIAPAPPVPVTPLRATAAGREPKAERLPPTPPQPVQKNWWELRSVQIGGVAAVALAGAGIAFLVHRQDVKDAKAANGLQTVAGSDVVSPTPAEATPAGTPRVSQTPPFSPAPIVTGSPRPLPTASLELGKVLVPSIVAPSTTPPTVPDRREMLKARIKEAEEYETVRDWPRCIAAYAAITREFSEVDTGRVRLQMVITSLRRTLDKMGDDEFARYIGPITEAARLDIMPAMMILGERLRKTATSDAFNWFCAAAAHGDALAMAQVGLFYSNGAPGVERDLTKAASWFQQSAEKGNAAGKLFLAECYLNALGVPKKDEAKAAWWFQQSADKGNAAGKLFLAECYLNALGVPKKDEAKAVALLRESAEDGDPRAINLLGTCHHHGRGTGQNFTEAHRLFQKASEAGFDDATANLGVLYIKGEGVTKDERKAVELFRKGANNSNALCMFFLAQCLQNGKGTERNELDAERWYQKSAALGNRLAIEWCQKNRVPVPK